MAVVTFLLVLFSFQVHARDFLPSQSALEPDDSLAQVAEAAQNRLGATLDMMSLRQQLEEDGVGAKFLDNFVLDPGSTQEVQFWVPKPSNVASSFLQSSNVREVGMSDELVDQVMINNASSATIKEIAKTAAGDDQAASLRLEQQLSAFVEQVSRDFVKSTQAALQQQTEALNRTFSEQTQQVVKELKQQTQGLNGATQQVVKELQQQTQGLNGAFSEQTHQVVKELQQQTELLKAKANATDATGGTGDCSIILHKRTVLVGASNVRRVGRWLAGTNHDITGENSPTACDKPQGLTYVPNSGLLKLKYGSFAYVCCASMESSSQISAPGGGPKSTP